MNIIQKKGILIATSLILILFALHNPFQGYKYVGYYDFDNIPTQEKLVKVLKNKYPQYNKYSDSLLFVKLTEKYPGYLKQTNNSIETPVLIGGNVSKKAVFKFIDEKSELFGFSLPIILFLIIWLLLFKTNNNSKNT